MVATALVLQMCGPAEAAHKIGPRFFGIHARNLAVALPKTSFGSVDLTTNKMYGSAFGASEPPFRPEAGRLRETLETWSPTSGRGAPGTCSTRGPATG